LWDFAFREGDIILVGRESAGVPQTVSAAADSRLRIPIRPRLRSLNVGIAATIAITEALRQLGRLPSMIERKL
jgi:tRNA (cytidine/uridine-2'-O-)-methyltransferase